MAALKSANVTKYDAGGSGDNCISDGYIKSVEKVWIDSYTFASALNTTDSICIGIVPAGKHLTDVIVFTPAVMTLDTLCTVYLCTGQTVATSTYFGAMKADGFATTTFNGGTAATLRLAPAYHDITLPSATAETKIYMSLHPSNGKATPVTSGTIRSIIKYT